MCTVLWNRIRALADSPYSGNIGDKSFEFRWKFCFCDVPNKYKTLDYTNEENRVLRWQQPASIWWKKDYEGIWQRENWYKWVKCVRVSGGKHHRRLSKCVVECDCEQMPQQCAILPSVFLHFISLLCVIPDNIFSMMRSRKMWEKNANTFFVRLLLLLFGWRILPACVYYFLALCHYHLERNIR